MELLLETDLPNLYYRGKVRDIYALGDDLLLIATDRVSAFDSILPAGIPDKGTGGMRPYYPGCAIDLAAAIA